MKQEKNKVNIVLGILSFAAAIGMVINMVCHINKYGDIAKTSDMTSYCITLSVGIAIMVIIGLVLINSRKHDPYKRIAHMLFLLLAAGYGTSCLNHMLVYVAVSPAYYESHQN